jgi:hypothetical protein
MVAEVTLKEARDRAIMAMNCMVTLGKKDRLFVEFGRRVCSEDGRRY